MPSLMNNEITRIHEGSVAGNLVHINIAGKTPDGLCAQQIQASVSKQVQTVYEIGTENYYIIDGRPSGTGSIQNLIGPNSYEISCILAKLADVCKPQTLEVRVDGGCGGSVGDDLTFTGMVLSQVGVTATTQSYAITGQAGFTFLDVETDACSEV